MKFLFSLITLFMTINSCSSSKETIKKSNKLQETLSGSYTITQIDNNKSFNNKLIITFDDKSNKISGFAGCNSIYGDYTLKGDVIKFNNVSSSKKYCQKEIMTLEKDFLEALNTINKFTIKDNILSFSKNNNILLKATKSSVVKKDKLVKKNSKTAITYQTSTRGSFQYLYISESNITISEDRNLKSRNNYQCKPKDWEELNKLIKTIDIEAFQKLEALSKDRFSDAVAEAKLTIQMGDTEHTTPPFDHGNPSKEIETLVNKVLSIKENALKQ